jgi:hypothetical protein
MNQGSVACAVNSIHWYDAMFRLELAPLGFRPLFDAEWIWLDASDAVREVARFGAGLPIVGYLAGESLARVVRLGFRTVGPLRVWVTGAR